MRQIVAGGLVAGLCGFLLELAVLGASDGIDDAGEAFAALAVVIPLAVIVIPLAAGLVGGVVSRRVDGVLSSIVGAFVGIFAAFSVNSGSLITPVPMLGANLGPIVVLLAAIAIGHVLGVVIRLPARAT